MYNLAPGGSHRRTECDGYPVLSRRAAEKRIRFAGFAKFPSHSTSFHIIPEHSAYPPPPSRLRISYASVRKAENPRQRRGVVLNMKMKSAPQVGVIMGSTSDWKTMSAAAGILEQFSVAFEKNVVSAHRTPHWLADYAGAAQKRGLQVIIAGAGGAAHLPGMAAAFTTLPVLGVPVESRALKGLDSLLSIAQMPAGVPVGTLAIGEPGAKNAALLASFDPVAARRKFARPLGSLSPKAD